MANAALNEILGETFANQDVAFALDHWNFADFKRNLQRGEGPKDRLVILPRNTGSAGVGGEFRYAHIIEFAIHMALGPVYSRECAKAVCFSLFRRLMHNDTGLAKFNALSREQQDALRFGSTFEAEDDPFQLSWFVDFPRVFLTDDLISRDRSARTYALFDVRKILHDTHSLILTDGSTSLADAHDRLTRLVLDGVSDDRTRQRFEDDVRAPGILDLTSMLAVIDERLRVRLAARQLRGS